jgi:hypothetical protein
VFFVTAVPTPGSTTPEVVAPLLAAIEPSIPAFAPKAVRIKVRPADRRLFVATGSNMPHCFGVFPAFFISQVSRIPRCERCCVVCVSVWVCVRVHTAAPWFVLAPCPMPDPR